MTGNPVSPLAGKLLEQEKLQNAEQAAGLNKVVFLAGPYIETACPPSASNKAAALRHRLYHALEKEGWTVTLGEYEKLIAATAPLLGINNNAAAAEIAHAKKNTTDAIIMLPSSPGSFLEFGAFSNIRDICSKMLIIVDKQYQNDKNYMSLGPIIAARINHAAIQFIDYSDFNQCWNEVKPFLERCAHSSMMARIAAP